MFFLLLILVFVLPDITLALECRPGFYAIGTLCLYQPSGRTVTFSQAKEECKKLDAVVAIPKNYADLIQMKYFFRLFFGPAWLWLGHTFEGVISNQYKYKDLFGRPDPYVRWEKGYPSRAALGKDKNCVVLHNPTLTTFDRSCDNTLAAFALCQERENALEASVANGKCTNGYFTWAGMCLRVPDKKLLLNQIDAARHCAKFGGVPPMPKSHFETSALERYRISSGIQSFWLGYKYAHGYSTVVDPDGIPAPFIESTIHALTMHQENCSILYATTGRFADLACHFKIQLGYLNLYKVPSSDGKDFFRIRKPCSVCYNQCKHVTLLIMQLYVKSDYCDGAGYTHNSGDMDGDGYCDSVCVYIIGKAENSISVAYYSPADNAFAYKMTAGLPDGRYPRAFCARGPRLRDVNKDGVADLVCLVSFFTKGNRMHLYYVLSMRSIGLPQVFYKTHLELRHLSLPKEQVMCTKWSDPHVECYVKPDFHVRKPCTRCQAQCSHVKYVNIADRYPFRLNWCAEVANIKFMSADFNGDGYCDLLCTSLGQNIYLFLYNPYTQKFIRSPKSLDAAGRFAANNFCKTQVEVQDINSDGYADVICRQGNKVNYALSSSMGLPTKLYKSPNDILTVYMKPDEIDCSSEEVPCEGKTYAIQCPFGFDKYEGLCLALGSKDATKGRDQATDICANIGGSLPFATNVMELLNLFEYKRFFSLAVPLLSSELFEHGPWN